MMMETATPVPTDSTQSGVSCVTSMEAPLSDSPNSSNPKVEESADAKKKRAADRQITKDDADDDHDAADESTSTNEATLRKPFPRASDQVLRTRRIVRVRRPGIVGPEHASTSNVTQMG